MVKTLLILLVAVVAEISTQCVDTHANCIYNSWRCNEQHVQNICPRTCGLCKVCQDKNLFCRFHRSKCYWDPNWAKNTCPYTCGVCTTTPTNPPTHFPPSTYKPSGECGKPDVQHGRVIAGTTAKRGSWPWQVLLKLYGREMCGGSIVSPYWIVTAAHCVDGKNAQSFAIKVGEHNTRVREGSEVEIRVTRIIVHSNWNRRTFDNDIAMMKLEKPITFNKYVKPVCLPSGDVALGTSCYITGWGKTSHPGSMTTILQQTDLPVVDNSVCERLNRNVIPVPITSAMICGGNGGTTRQSGCHGDSGGPFVCKVGDKWELHGAVSHGSPKCKSSQTYTVFARVNYFKTWIEDNMKYK